MDGTLAQVLSELYAKVAALDAATAKIAELEGALADFATAKKDADPRAAADSSPAGSE